MKTPAREPEARAAKSADAPVVWDEEAFAAAVAVIVADDESGPDEPMETL